MQFKCAYQYKIIYEDREDGEEKFLYVMAEDVESALFVYRDIEKIQRPALNYADRNRIYSVERGNTITYVEDTSG